MTNSLASKAVSKAAANHKSNRGELQSCSVEPAENGFTVRCSYRPAAKKGNGVNSMTDSWPEPEIMVFESAKSAAKYVQDTLVEHEAYEGSAEDKDDDE